MNEYQLVDFGDGRKLERIAGCLLDRPSPAAEGIARKNPAAWSKAQGKFEKLQGDQGKWNWRSSPPKPWTWTQGSVTMSLEATPFGHLGLFPEHAVYWKWLESWSHASQGPLKVLNLFAYTGGASIAAAGPGIEVVHVDSSKPSVQWARENARLSGKDQATIRWIVEDARVFCRREVKRGQAYHGVILDPPSYGHGAKGKLWSIETDLDELLSDLSVLLERSMDQGRGAFLIFTSHSPQLDQASTPRRLLDSMACLDDPRWQVSTVRNTLEDQHGRRLDFGIRSHWTLPASSQVR